jgi:hypothetical protein
MKTAAILALCVLVFFSHSQVITWTDKNGVWSDPNNWSPNRLPTENDAVEIYGNSTHKMHFNF